MQVRSLRVQPNVCKLRVLLIGSALSYLARRPIVARIKHPRPQLGTVKDRIGGVIFRDGFAEVDLANEPHLADAYKLHGYEVLEDAPKPKKRRGRKPERPFIVPLTPDEE